MDFHRLVVHLVDFSFLVASIWIIVNTLALVFKWDKF